MNIIHQEFTQTLEIKKSKFITHICPYSQFKGLMKNLKLKHPKGRHFVYAYRYINDFDQIVENSSDDGEPKGTSGKPTLNVLAGNELVNTAVIIVRYFGGIRLGTGGLVKAYSDATNLVIEHSTVETYVKLTQMSLTLSYSQLSQIEYIVNSFQIKTLEKKFEQNIVLILEADSNEFEQLSKQLFRDTPLQSIDL